MTRTRVAVLRGGPSAEHEVSLKTGEGVLAALNPEQYESQDIIIAKNGTWFRNGYELQPRFVTESADVVFNALHGAYGEDGGVQRELERYRIPYTGSGPFSSAVAMNKLQTKQRLQHLGIKMAPHLRVVHDDSNNYSQLAAAISNDFAPPYIVKPVAGGSSVNTVVARNEHELANALKHVVGEEGEVLVEKLIVGKEATCGVIEQFRGEALYKLPVVEIVPPELNGFFDYEAKYAGSTEEICPGRFDSATKRQLAEAAALVHATLELSQYSRSDFIIADDGVYFLEVNTLPGLTTASLLPKGLEAVGATYKEFIEHLIEDALVRRLRT